MVNKNLESLNYTCNNSKLMSQLYLYERIHNTGPFGNQTELSIADTETVLFHTFKYIPENVKHFGSQIATAHEPKMQEV